MQEKVARQEEEEKVQKKSARQRYRNRNRPRRNLTTTTTKKTTIWPSREGGMRKAGVKGERVALGEGAAATAKFRNRKCKCLHAQRTPYGPAGL